MARYGRGDRAAALKSIRAARQKIVRMAAAWQAKGIDTSPLTEPLFDIQEAMAALEEDQKAAARTRRRARKQAGG